MTPIYQLALRFVRWFERREEAAARRRQILLFPAGTRVRVNGKCCAIRTGGQFGTVTGPTSLLSDWWVKLDSGETEIYCANGMERVP